MLQVQVICTDAIESLEWRKNGWLIWWNVSTLTESCSQYSYHFPYLWGNHVSFKHLQLCIVCIYLYILASRVHITLAILVNVLCRFYCDIINKGNAITNVICVFFYYHIRRHPLTRALNVLDTMCSRASGVSLDWTHLQIVCCLVAVFERCHCLFGWNANTFVVLQAHLRPVCFLQWMLGQHVL